MKDTQNLLGVRLLGFRVRVRKAVKRAICLTPSFAYVRTYVQSEALYAKLCMPSFVCQALYAKLCMRGGVKTLVAKRSFISVGQKNVTRVNEQAYICAGMVLRTQLCAQNLPKRGSTRQRLCLR